MGNSNILSQQNISFIKNLIDNNTPYRDILRISSLSEDQLMQVIIRLRSKEDYRVYEGQSFFDYSLCNREEYIKQMNYKDAINSLKNPLRIILCSDMHLCSHADRPQLIDKLWDTAAELGVNHIINLGDLVEGVEYHNHNCGKAKIKIEPTLESQILYMNKYLPADKNVKQHILLGNHDLYSNDGISIDIAKELKDRYERKDIIVSGIEDTILPINNDHIHLLHRSYCDFVKEYLKKYEDCEENQIMFCGHAHISKTISSSGYNMEYVPPLSDLPRNNRETPFYIGFLIMTVYFNNNLQMKDVHIQRYRFDKSYSKPVCFHSHDVRVRRLKK